MFFRSNSSQRYYVGARAPIQRERCSDLPAARLPDGQGRQVPPTPRPVTLDKPVKGCLAHSSPCAGFTLLEILITMAILAVLATMVYASFNASIKIIERVDSEADIYRGARFILTRLSEELSMAYRPKGKGMPEVIFVGQNGVMAGRPLDSLRFTSLSHSRSVADQAASDLNLIEYRLERGPEDKGWVLLHRERNNLYGLSQGGGGEFVIAEGIYSLNLRYFDGKTWVEGWDAESEKALPLAVEIEILFQEPRGGQRSFKSWVELPLAK